MLSFSLLAISAGLWIPWVLNVNVTNFPLDEQGNLKVSSGAFSKVITVTKDLNLSWTGGVDNHYVWEIFTVETDGYSELYLYISVRNWTVPMQSINSNIYFIVDGIAANVGKEKGSSSFTIVHEYEDYGYPINASARYYVWGTTARIHVEANAADPYPAGWVLVSVSLYLRN